MPWARAVLLPLPPPLWAHAQPAPAHPPACLQIGQLDEKLAELEQERAELAEYQQHDRQRRSLSQDRIHSKCSYKKSRS